MTETQETKIALTLPIAQKPIANYLAVQKSDKNLFISGQLPFIAGEENITGKVGKDVSIKQAQRAAHNCALNILAQAKEFLKGLDNIEKIIKITVFIAASPDFTDLALVANGASDVFFKILGEKGLHARSTFGVSTLPLNAPVEIEAILEIKNTP